MVVIPEIAPPGSPNSPGSGNGNNSGGGGGGGGSSSDPYTKSYLAVLYQLYGSTTASELQKKLMAQAKANKWAGSMFLEMLRRKDPAYVRSDDYKERAAYFRDFFKSYFGPRMHVPVRELNRWVRSGLGKNWLKQRLQSMPAYKKMFPYINLGATINTPQEYRAYRAALNRSYQFYLGRVATPAEQRMFFARDMTPQELESNLQGVLGGQEAMAWAFGAPMSRKEKNELIFMKKGGIKQAQALGRATAIKSSFIGSQAMPYATSFNEAGQPIMSTI